MKITADENMPFALEAFGSLGEVALAPGREMNAGMLKDTDCLAIRSITKVNEELLAGTPVKFVGTATIGTDHVDQEYLKSAGVGFSSAPGCNAISVSEYVMTALHQVAVRKGITLEGKTIGIIGVGNVGSRVEKRARALGLEVVLNDPPLAEKTGDKKYLPLDELIECADIVTVHVPLEKGGAHPTYHLLDESLLARLKPGVILLNTSRGAVASGAAVEAAIDSGALGAVVLDVWEGEPEVRAGLLEKVDIGTPHIAGHSFDGKAWGTKMIYDSACACFGVEPEWTLEGLLPAPANPVIDLTGDKGDAQALLARVTLESYDILADDKNLRAILELPNDERAKKFDGLRKGYAVRREFASRTVKLAPGQEGIAGTLEGWDFKVVVG